MNIYSIDNLEILNNLELTNLEILKDNNYKSNVFFNNKEIFLEFPKCKTKSGLCVNNNSFIDLVYDNSINILNEWINTLENNLSKKIYEKNNVWFTNPINQNVITNMITPLYRKYNNKLLIRTYINVNKNININDLHINLEKNEIIPILKLDYLIINSNSFDIKFTIFKINILEKQDLEKNISNNNLNEVNLVINEETPIKLKKHNEVYLKYYKETIIKAKHLKNEAIKKYLEAKHIKSNILNFDDLDKDIFMDENNEINELNKLNEI